ncbi:hypothetical protein BDA99DRAFT_543837 [Phascolomyces articulosus]|uniref:F-box domain-containing protein n=1 Tax=Phascolomyces articulosus TaxID=60185 RepID=A0AAD5JMM6_9FUNG|nr:hypothetical protein BDA99DRAFT_543837 [Phascolomyces articulosus]
MIHGISQRSISNVDDVSNPPPSLSPNDTTHLTQFNFDSTLKEKNIHLIPILQRSPHLEFLMMQGGSYHGLHGGFLLPDFHQLFIWCPNLIYLEINTGHLRYEYRDIWMKRLTKNLKENTDKSSQVKKGLRCFLACEEEEFGAQQMGPILQHHADTLELIALTVNTTQQTWVSVFQQLQLPNLHTLLCDGTQYDDTSMRALVSHSPHLQHLTLNADNDIHLHLGKLLKMSSCALQLKSLHLGQLYLSYDETQSVDPNLIPLLSPMALATVPPLAFVDDSLHGTTTAVASTDDDKAPERLFQYLNDHGCQLNEISLKFIIQVNDTVPIAIAHVSSLTSLTIDFTIINLYMDDELLLLIQKLQQETRIEHLKLFHIRTLDVRMLDALGDLSYLKTFQSCGKIFYLLELDGWALIHMLEKSPRVSEIHFRNLKITGVSVIDQYRRKIENESDDEENDPTMDFLTDNIKGYMVINHALSTTYFDVDIRRIL